MSALSNLSITKRFMLVLVLGVAFQACTPVISLIHLKHSLIQARTTEVKHLLEVAYATVVFYHDQATKGLMSDNDAREAARSAVRAMHFDGSNYYFIWTLDGTGVAHGSHPEWEGRTFINSPDADKFPVVSYMVSQLVEVCRTDKKEGVATYRISKPGQTIPLDKIAYTRLFEPWGWSIGTGAYVDDIEATFWSEALSILWLFIGLIVLAATVTFVIGRNLEHAVKRLSGRVASVAQGEFEGDVPEIERGDEVGAMARALKEADAKLRRERAKLLAVLDSASIGIVTMDGRGTILSANPAMGTIFERSAPEMVGMDIGLLIPGLTQNDDGTLWDRYRGDDGKGPVGEPREFNGFHKDGSAFPAELTVNWIRDYGELATFIGMVTDISKRHAADAAVRRLSSAVENSSAVVVITDREGVIEYANPRCSEISGRQRSDLIGRTPAIFKSGNTDDATYRAMWLAITSGEVWQGEFLNRRKDGSLYWVKANIDPIRNETGRITHFVAVQEDVTESRKAQKALEKALEAAESANRAKSEFLSSMSHELRTPLNAVIGFAQMLEYNPKEILTQSQKKCVEHILNSGRHLLELITEILDLARIEEGRLELSVEDISITDLLEECRSYLHPLAERHGIVVTIAPCPGLTVRADHTRLKQVILNLLSNSVKYNRPGGRANVTVAMSAGGGLEITVDDDGLGIPENRRDELFKPFSRLGQENSGIEGTGIGMTITKRLVEMMGGVIGFDSVDGAGTTFRVALPPSSTEPRVADGLGKLAQADAPGMRGTVVYVEDNPANVELMEMVVSRLDGVRLLTASTGEGGLDLIRSARPDLIILDLNLPGMDGYEILNQLRQFGESRDVPVFALTASATRSDIARGRQAGFQKYFTKPFAVDSLIRAIAEGLGETRSDPPGSANRTLSPLQEGSDSAD